MVMDEDQEHALRNKEQRLNDALQHIERQFKSYRIAGECEACGQSTDDLKTVTQWNKQKKRICAACSSKKMKEHMTEIVSQGW